MSDEEKPDVSLVSSRSKEEMLQQEIRLDIGWPTREFVANLMRVIRGAGRPHALIPQLFELTKELSDAHEKAGAWIVNQAFYEVLNETLPDWEWDVHTRGDLHTILRGSLQVMASSMVGQSTQLVAGRHEMLEGVNAIQRRREEERRQREEDHRAYLQSVRSTPTKRRKPRPKPKAPKASAPVVTPAPPEPAPEQPSSTWELMKLNRQRIAEGKEPI